MKKNKDHIRTEKILMRITLIAVFIGLLLITLTGNSQFGNEENKDLIRILIYCVVAFLFAVYIVFKVRADKQREEKMARRSEKEIDEEINDLLSEIPDENK